MSKSATVQARIEPELKAKAEGIFQALGLSTTQAVTLFYQQVILRSGLPFDVVIPNETTIETFEKTDSGKDLVVCESPGELLDKLGL